MEPCGVVLKQVIDRRTGKVRVGLCLYQEDDSGDEVTYVLVAILDPEVTHRYSFAEDGVATFVKPRSWWEFWR